MIMLRLFSVILTALLLLVPVDPTRACSMYKLTVDGTTMVGCNEDAWRTTSRIWFETAGQSGAYGACFTGSRQVAPDRTAPQSGMNERGLTFSRLAAWHPRQQNPFSHRLPITDEVDYLSDILHQCATVTEVRAYIEAYDHSIFLEDVFIYIDPSGHYLIVEPYALIEGRDPTYVLSNFCPSITDPGRARQLERYRNGDDYLQRHAPEASLDYCTALSDTMHVCRKRNGDGTLLTSIWNTRDGSVNLYFYHDYDTTVQFHLAKELAKGDHSMAIPDLFAPNPEFARLSSYKTPLNTPILRVGLVALGGMLMLLSLLLVISYIRGIKVEFSLRTVLLLLTMNVILTGYLVVLATNLSIYYFDAPYTHSGSPLISAASYTPFLLLVIMIVLIPVILKDIRSNNSRSWTRVLYGSHGLIYMFLMTAFAYWGLYDIWS
ncbi:MAG: hypothetical protein H6568_11130 [Lewinellaceae bacterium]|nr:hypothetical protein [Saprospiraceae bacterium]MCB9313309.1 hypothetical protein [Lewinellaceae bacterium]